MFWAARAPAILELTQYDIDGGRHQDFKTFVARGYVFVQVEVRGRRLVQEYKIQDARTLTSCSTCHR